MPRRIFTRSHIDYVIDRLTWLCDNRAMIGGLLCRGCLAGPLLLAQGVAQQRDGHGSGAVEISSLYHLKSLFFNTFSYSLIIFLTIAPLSKVFLGIISNTLSPSRITL